ncbi:hypothetical protein G5V65_14575 [Rhodobacter sp. HX-7-19]|uniref:DNA-binding protein n=1 Tax=Paragemmobacter kunshanensis TaxID=2583234 RepID=A0A6M1TVG4_9RHOB|nr:HU family DNA-binding protein [Rhodobacter kunshanensis]NGQ92120.1 hypothetical protein [Rhodobacter kunshanensis]
MATSSASKSAVKKPAAKKPAAKPAVKAVVAAPKIAAPVLASVPAAPPADAAALARPAKAAAGPQLKKKELLSRVVAALDGKKKGGVKEIVEATLATLGEALQKGESLNLPPLGKARVARTKGEGAEQQITLRLRGAGEKNAPKGPKEALAEVGEDD